MKTLDPHSPALSPVARPWMTALARALIPDYCDPGLVYHRLLKTTLSRAGSWVDAGCGDNRDILGEPGYQGLAVGFDLPVRSGEKYVAADIRAIPFKDRSVDFVSCRWVFEHLRRPEEALTELARVLKPGGRLLVRTTNRFHYNALGSRLFPLALKRRLSRKEVFPTYYRLNDWFALKRMLKNHPTLALEKVRYIEQLHYGSAPGFVFSVLTEWLLNALRVGGLKTAIILEIAGR